MKVVKVEKVEGTRKAYDLTIKNTHCYFVGPGVLAHNCSFTYVDGVLQRVLTRGGGEEGEDITRNALKMRGVKRVLSTRFTGDLRGEAMFVAPEFAAYNAKAASTKNWTVFKNMRNGASGLARRHSGDGVEFLRVFFYELKSDVLDFDSHFEKMSYLRKILGLWTPWYARVDLKGLEEIYDKYESEIRENLIYEIDGLVIKVDSASECEDIESTMQTSSRTTANPKSQVAWKFMAETRVTTLLDVEWEFGLGGRITPVAILSPVMIGGVEVRRASLSTFSRVATLKLWKGCKVLISRRNDVIPYLEKNLEINM